MARGGGRYVFREEKRINNPKNARKLIQPTIQTERRRDLQSDHEAIHPYVHHQVTAAAADSPQEKEKTKKKKENEQVKE